MRHVDEQANTVHLLDDLASHTRDAGIRRLVAAGREQALVIVGELHEPDAQPMADLDETDIVLDRRRVLHAEEDRGAVLPARTADVSRAAAVVDELRESLEPAVPAFDIGDRLAEILVIGDGGMNRGNATAPHLAKDRLGPVAVLQAVDDDVGLFLHASPAFPCGMRSPLAMPGWMISKPRASFNRQMRRCVLLRGFPDPRSML